VSRLRLHRISDRLLLLFFAIAGSAVAFVYVYVVPQLESSLTVEKLRRQEGQAVEQAPELARTLQRNAPPAELRRVVESVAQATETRATVLGVREVEGELQPAFVISDSEAERTAALPRYDVAALAAATGRIGSATESVGGERIGETAVPIPGPEGKPVWVAVFSSSLADVEDDVALIKRQILIAGVIALAIAMAAGYWAARSISGRLRRLEGAAAQVAEGDFAARIPEDSSDELGQLARTFNLMQGRLAQLDSARKEFIANASHELRTPIFSLGGFVELLEEEHPDPASRQEFVRNMREQIERLTKLTTDLLDLSKLDAGAMEIRPEQVDLNRLAQGIVEEFQPAASSHASAVELRSAPSSPLALADPDRVGQIVRILLDNALRHTPEGTRVIVTTTSQNGAAELTVSDEGRGIRLASRDRVFERFFTGDEGSGSGLGLAIAQELATRMDGRLELRSGHGLTTFKLALPLA
jgi:signal transduction histidine kinase